MEDNLTNYAPMRMYKRYSGLLQGHPLTVSEQEYDDTCRAIDYAEKEIGKKSMTLFTADEFLWFSWFSNKVFYFPKQEQLDRQLVEIGELLKTLEERQK